MVDDVTTAVALVVGIGVGLSPFVFAAVSMLRGMLGSHRRRRIILPLAGVALGWLFASLVLVLLESPSSSKNIAVTFLAGFWAYVVAAGLNAQGKESRRG